MLKRLQGDYGNIYPSFVLNGDLITLAVHESFGYICSHSGGALNELASSSMYSLLLLRYCMSFSARSPTACYFQCVEIGNSSTAWRRAVIPFP